MSIHDVSAVSATAVPLALALALFAIADLERFVLVAVTAALILPSAIFRPGGAQVALADLLILVGVGSWLIASAAGAAPKPHLRGNSFVLPGLLFVGYNVISLAWSVNAGETIKFTIQLTEIVILGPLLFATVPRSWKALHQGMFVFMACTIVLALFTLVTYSPNTEGALAAEGGVLGGLNKNVVGSYLGAGLIMAASFWMCAEGTARRRIFLVLTLIEVAGLLSTISRGSIIGALFAACAASLLLKRKRTAVIVSAIGVATFYLAVVGPGSTADTSRAGSYDSSEVRKYSYENGVDQIRERPFLGTGGGTYIGVLPELDGFIVPDPNNTFLLTWGELGIGGFLLLLFLFWRFLRLLLIVRTLALEYACPAVAGGCVSLSLFIHFQFDVTWTRGTTTLAFAMIGLMVAAERLAVVQSARQRRPTEARVPPRVVARPTTSPVA